MYWNSFAEFLAMGRHGVYVWGSFAGMALLMIAEPLLVVRGQRTLIERLRRQLRADKGDRNTSSRASPTVSNPSEGQP